MLNTLVIVRPVCLRPVAHLILMLMHMSCDWPARLRLSIFPSFNFSPHELGWKKSIALKVVATVNKEMGVLPLKVYP